MFEFMRQYEARARSRSFLGAISAERRPERRIDWGERRPVTKREKQFAAGVLILLLIVTLGPRLFPGAYCGNRYTERGADAAEKIINLGRGCSLYAAIADANQDESLRGIKDGHVTIRLTGNVTLTREMPPIDSQVTIDGGGHRISGDSKFQIFTVERGGVLTVKDVTLSRGAASNGAAIHNSGNLFIRGSSFSENRADDSGGAVYSVGELQISDSKFSENRANSAGGAVYGQAKIDISGSEFKSNTGRGNAGAVYSRRALSLSGSSFSHNSTNGQGGAIISRSATNISGSQFADNRAREDGGAIATDGELTIKDGSFSDNSSGDSGGAILSIRSTTISGSRFSRNKTVHHGGAIYGKGPLRIEGSSFSDNAAEGSGGALTSLGTANISDGEFTRNRADSDGGAIYNGESGVLNLRDSRFSNNLAGESGGALFNAGKADISDGEFTGNRANHNGGAILNGASGAIKLSSSKFSNNTAKVAGGGIYNLNRAIVSLRGGNIFAANQPDGCHGIRCGIPGVSAVNTAAELAAAIQYANQVGITRAISLGANIRLNEALPPIASAITIDGKGFSIHGGDRHRIFCVMRRGQLTIQNLTLVDGSARGSGAICGGGLEGGGAIVSYGRLQVKASKFMSNAARQGKGGALMLAGATTVIGEGSTFDGNLAAEGGAIAAACGSTAISDSVFIQNGADLNGGALHLNSKCRSDATAIDVNDSVFQRNRADRRGGAAFSNRGSLSISKTMFTHNSAAAGGGIYATRSTDAFQLSDSILGDNRGGDCFSDKELSANTDNRIRDGSCNTP